MADELGADFAAGEWASAQVGATRPRTLMRETSDLAVWDLAGIPIVVKSRHFVERRDFPPLWGSPPGPRPSDPTLRA